MSDISTGSNKPGELEVSSTTSVVSVPVFGEAELSVPVAVSFVGVLEGGTAEIDVSACECATFVTPTLISWATSSSNTGPTSAEVTVVLATTGGSPCTAQFKLVYDGSTSVLFPFTSPEQNSPHAGWNVTRFPECLGHYSDLYWRWISDGHSSDYELVEANAVYIPAEGEPDHEDSGGA